MTSDKRAAPALVLAAFLLASVPGAKPGGGGGPSSTSLSFPRDDGSHPSAAVEWWYYTGHLTDATRREYGFQLTFFRVGDLHLAHFAWSDVARQSFRYEEKTHLGLPGIASAAEGRLDVRNEDWSAAEKNGVFRLRARGKGWGLGLALRPEKPPVVNGERGISRKGPGEREYSHYVSITRLAATGRFRRDGASETVSGAAWFDHEWGPGALPRDAAGWDWFALQLEDGSDLMLYRMRGPDGRATPFSSGAFVPRKGAPTRISWNDVRLTETRFWTSPGSGARYPAGWRIAVAPLGLELEVEPLIPDQELSTEKSTGVTYWEGTCWVRGKRRGRPTAGRAYVEMTGYAGRDVPGFGAQAPN